MHRPSSYRRTPVSRDYAITSGGLDTGFRRYDGKKKEGSSMTEEKTLEASSEELCTALKPFGNPLPHRLSEEDIRKRETDRYLNNLFPWLY